MIALLTSLIAAAQTAPDAPAPPPPPPGAVAITLADALKLAQQTSETVRSAEDQVDQAKGDVWSARSAFLPQISGSVLYTHTFASEYDSLLSGGFGGFGGFGGPVGGTPTPTTQPTATSVPTTLTTTPTGTPTAPTGTATTPTGGGSTPTLPFGQPNTWRAGFEVDELLFGGGRSIALYHIANSSVRSAEVGLEAARATNALDTVTAYYDAALSDRLLEISTQSLAQAQATLRQTELAQGVGKQPEFDLLRAQVTVQNQQVAVINAQRQRDLAHQRLGQLLQIPLETPLVLVSPLEDTDVTSVAVDVSGASTPGTPRATVRQLTEAQQISQSNVSVARADALPTLAAQANVGWVTYPSDGVPFGDGDKWLSSVNASVSLSVPLFNGGRVWGAYQKARAGADQAEANLQQTTELADLDARRAQSALDAANAQHDATAGVVEQARRAYEIAEIRFQEGVSTQLELDDARLQLQQALVNRAQSARDLAVAKIRLALLSSLPLSGASTGAGGNF
jgi:outer membrane protein TolC